ncbi:MAG: tRNA (cytidine(56)-2'-O)-methyltransferase [Candidatus Altiarchaeota archaeon]|nr:tRNA (cytidine(56)-2'-O)-methyltransferase [Candidatus Altiarchaeota archaeon]
MIKVMRFGHRKGRDTRITTHVGLVARAFGADEFILANTDAKGPLQTITDICSRWGGAEFKTGTVTNWKKAITDFQKNGGVVCHLTMYGMPLSDSLPKLQQHLGQKKNLLVFVGAEKVPSEIYDLVDFNVAVGNQPHSEVGALAVFLDRLLDGRPVEDTSRFSDAKLSIVPQEHGKKTLEKT